jgi:hypothetical protein
MFSLTQSFIARWQVAQTLQMKTENLILIGLKSMLKWSVDLVNFATVQTSLKFRDVKPIFI